MSICESGQCSHSSLFRAWLRCLPKTVNNRNTAVTGHGPQAGTKKGHHTRTRTTRGPLTAGLPVPVLHPIQQWPVAEVWLTLLTGATWLFNVQLRSEHAYADTYRLSQLFSLW
jgi:hypothetical protein